ADELPANQAGVAPVHRVAEHAFDGVRPEELEESRGLDGFQPLILLRGGELGEVAQGANTVAIDFARIRLVLVTVLGNRLHPGPLRVAILVASIGTGEL